VADLFIAAGLSAERFILRGVGATRLMVNKLSPVNDRVEIVLLFQ